MSTTCRFTKRYHKWKWPTSATTTLTDIPFRVHHYKCQAHWEVSLDDESIYHKLLLNLRTYRWAGKAWASFHYPHFLLTVPEPWSGTEPWLEHLPPPPLFSSSPWPATAAAVAQTLGSHGPAEGNVNGSLNKLWVTDNSYYHTLCNNKQPQTWDKETDSAARVTAVVIVKRSYVFPRLQVWVYFTQVSCCQVG